MNRPEPTGAWHILWRGLLDGAIIQTRGSLAATKSPLSVANSFLVAGQGGNESPGGAVSIRGLWWLRRERGPRDGAGSAKHREWSPCFWAG